MVIQPFFTWSPRKKLMVGGMAFAILLALGIGLGVGVSNARHIPKHSSSSSSSSSTGDANVPTSTSSSTPSGMWQPSKGLTWNYQLSTTPSTTNIDLYDVWDIDLFSNDATTIAALQATGSKVICYFSAGSYEDWRPDKDQFQNGDLGSDLEGWPGEKWLNVNSQNVHKIMEARLDIAVQKKCDGVDPDNVDGYNNNNGLGLTETDAVNYMQFLADAAHSRGLAIGLKNAGDIIPNVIDSMQWSVNEQCAQYDECDTYAVFIQRNKPVFHVEYPKGGNTNNNMAVSSDAKSKSCVSNGSDGFSTIIKNMNLDAWTESCNGTTSDKEVAW